MIFYSSSPAPDLGAGLLYFAEAVFVTFINCRYLLRAEKNGLSRSVRIAFWL